MSSVNDLRSAIELIKSIPGEYVETDVEVDPKAELSGVYRYVGAAGTVTRPTKVGPAMMFNTIKGHPDARVIIGMLASRKRVAALLGTEPEKLGFYLKDAVKSDQSGRIFVASSCKFAPNQYHGDTSCKTYHNQSVHIFGVIMQEDD